ncbi:DUF2206 domain-containing protein [Methanobacterium sp.]|uniref:DUF2206 domain-containing protein n=1 Tax=Methanobacterium sp. TaxID=2164 RepID=UPI0031597E20
MDKSDKPVKMLNFFKMNNWGIYKFLNTILVIQTFLLIFLVLDRVGIHIPILREVTAVIYLLFVPGILILRILRLHDLNSVETLLYSVGLSITSIMCIGFIMNLIYPILGILSPISLPYLIVTISALVLILCLLSYIMDKNYCNEEYINLKDFLSPSPLFLFIIPFFAVIGTYLMNFYQNNLVLMLMIITISFVVILVAFGKIGVKWYPLAVFVIAVSLLFHTSLVSMNLWGWDILQEYNLSNLVIANAYWNLSLPFEINAMLSITILAPILSLISSLNLVWVLKIIYPLIFALVPLGLYLIFKKQTNAKIAFLSVFFFMLVFTFYRELPQLARQEVAELFFMLIILLMIDLKMNKLKRNILFIVFSFSMIISHYGLSYIVMLSILVFYILVEALKKDIILNTAQKLKIKLSLTANLNNNLQMLSSSFILFFIIFALSWYLYVSSSFLIERILDIGVHILNSISMDFLSPETSQGLTAFTVSISSPLHKIPAYINYLFQAFIVMGILSVIKNHEYKFKTVFVLFALINLGILILSVILPFFASSLNLTRIYHITLFFLAPFAVVGGIYCFRIVYKVFKRKWTADSLKMSIRILSILQILLFLFFTGFIYEITQDEPTSFSISSVDYPVFSDQDVLCAKWLYDFKNSNITYTDIYRQQLFKSLELNISMIRTLNPNNNFWVYPDSYIFIGKFNTLNKLVFVSNSSKSSEGYYVDIEGVIDNKSLLYSNGFSQIYYRSNY